MSTKAELKQEVVRLTEENEFLAKQYADARSYHREQLDALAEKNFPFDWHKAGSSYGQPICLAGNYNNDEGFSLELYTNSEGDIIGGVVMLRNDLDNLGAFGMVPAEIFKA